MIIIQKFLKFNVLNARCKSHFPYVACFYWRAHSPLLLNTLNITSFHIANQNVEFLVRLMLHSLISDNIKTLGVPPLLSGMCLPSCRPPPRVRVPSTPSMLLSFVVFMLYLSCKKNENKQKEVGIKRIKRKTAYFIKKLSKICTLCKHIKSNV